MATEQYVSPLYAAFLSAYDIGDDTAATVDPDLFKQYVALRKTAQDYAKSFNVSMLRRESDLLKSALKAQEQSQSYHAKLEGIKSEDRQATVKALVDRANNIDENYTRLAGQMSKFDSQLFLPAQSAFEKAGGGRGGAGAVAGAWETLFQTTTSKGSRAVGSDPESVGLATQMVKMTMGVSDLTLVTPEQVQARVAETGSPQLAANAAQFVREAQQKNAEVITTLKSLDESRRELRQIEARGRIQNLTQDQVERAQRVSAQAEEVLRNSFGGTPEELSQRLEDLRARDTEYQGLLNDARKAYDLAVQPGQEGLRTRMGRILANPDFMQWAKDNGFKSLGRSVISENGEVVYVQGRDDAQAIARYAYQAANPDRYGPLFGRRGSTNELVRVTATDPEMRAKILEQNKLADGRYAVDAKGALLSPRDYAREMEREGFAPTIQYASPASGEIYLKNAEGTVYKFNATTGAYEQVTGPDNLKFKPAIVYDSAGAPLRYMTQSDIADGNAEVGFDSDGTETKAIEAKSPFKLVGADQLQGVGEISVVGYRDRLHAGQAAQYGTGAISLNNGQYTFTRGAKIEVLGEDKPDLAVGAARLLPKQPRQEALGELAEKREAGLDYARLSPEELRAVPTPQPPPPPPAPEVIPTALDELAAESPYAFARGEAAERTGVGSVEGVRAAVRATQPGPAAAPAVEPGTGVAWDDAGYKFSIDPKAKTITVVDAPEGKQMPGKTVFTFEEFSREDRTGSSPFKRLKGTPPAPTAPAAPVASAPTGPVSVTTTPKPKPESYTVGARAGSATVTYETKPKPKEGLFAKLAAAREARRAERPAGTPEQRRSAEVQKRRMEAIEAGKGAEAQLPEAEEPTAAASVSVPATASVTSTAATKKKPAALQKIQQAAFPKTEEVGVA